jgi:hypothetical protein
MVSTKQYVNLPAGTTFLGGLTAITDVPNVIGSMFTLHSDTPYQELGYMDMSSFLSLRSESDLECIPYPDYMSYYDLDKKHRRLILGIQEIMSNPKLYPMSSEYVNFFYEYLLSTVSGDVGDPNVFASNILHWVSGGPIGDYLEHLPHLPLTGYTFDNASTFAIRAQLLLHTNKRKQIAV